MIYELRGDDIWQDLGTFNDLIEANILLRSIKSKRFLDYGI